MPPRASAAGWLSIPARCGVLKVPEDRTRPGGASVDLSVAVVPALNRRAAAAPLFLLAGGPGQGAMGMYVSLAAAFARANRNHAIVLVDQRGTGKSAPLSCEYPEDWQAPDDGNAGAAAGDSGLPLQVRRPGAFLHHERGGGAISLRCARRWGIGTIDLYGVSYGTRVARALHAALPPIGACGDLGWSHLSANRPSVLKLRLTASARWISSSTRCVESPDCAAAYPDLRQDLDGLLRQFGPQKSMLDHRRSEHRSAAESRVQSQHAEPSLRFLSYSAAPGLIVAHPDSSRRPRAPWRRSPRRPS